MTFIRRESKREMEETEARLIAVHQPELNTVGRSPLMPMTAVEWGPLRHNHGGRPVNDLA